MELSSSPAKGSPGRTNLLTNPAFDLAITQTVTRVMSHVDARTEVHFERMQDSLDRIATALGAPAPPPPPVAHNPAPAPAFTPAPGYQPFSYQGQQSAAPHPGPFVNAQAASNAFGNQQGSGFSNTGSPMAANPMVTLPTPAGGRDGMNVMAASGPATHAMPEYFDPVKQQELIDALNNHTNMLRQFLDATSQMTGSIIRSSANHGGPSGTTTSNQARARRD